MSMLGRLKLEVISLRDRRELLRPSHLWAHASATHADEDQRNHGGRDTALQRCAQHVHLDLPLLKAQTLLPRPLLFLSSLVLLDLGLQPIPHVFLSSLPLLGRAGELWPGISLLMTLG